MTAHRMFTPRLPRKAKLQAWGEPLACQATMAGNDGPIKNSDYINKSRELMLKTLSAKVSVLLLQSVPLLAMSGLWADELPEEFGAVAVSADRLLELESQLQQSLQTFDSMLLKEQDLLDAPAASSSVSAKQWEAEQAGGGQQPPAAGSQTQAEGARAGERGDAPGQQSGAGQGQGQPGVMAADEGSSSGRHGEEAASAAASGSGSGTGEGVPVNMQDRANDDIVARQLREAAEQETDPALKARLWEEYYRYKAGGR